MHLRRWMIAVGLLVVFGITLVVPNTTSAKSVRRGLEIYLVDVEGGGATLIVTPAGESVLIDGGWKTKNGRDSKRVLSVMRKARLDHLDYVIVSHYHSDHLGGVVELAKQVKVTNFLDRGPIGKMPPYVSQELYSEYMAIAKGRRRAVEPGEEIALKGGTGVPVATIEILAANGRTMTAKDGKSNSKCTGTKPDEVDTGENANSIAMLVKFGAFRYFDGADLTWNKEGQLVCPMNQIGTVNVYQVDHHGKATSNNPDLIASLHPQAAIMNNGADKGGDPAVFATLLRNLPLKDIYQIHRNIRTDPGSNAANENLANPDAGDGGFGFEVNVRFDGGSYEVINERTNKSRTYSTAREIGDR